MKEKFKELCSVMRRLSAESGVDGPVFTGAPAEEPEIPGLLADLAKRFPEEWIFAMEKVRSTRGPGKVVGALSFRDIGRALGEGKRVTVLMRHAERPPLDPSDTSFGEMLPITELGKETSVVFGEMLADAVSRAPVKVFCSRTFRTIQTACGIMRGLGMEGLPAVDDVLGGATPFFGSLDERMELIAEGRYMERLNEYFRTGVQRGYRPLGQAVSAMEERLAGFHGGSVGLVVAVTHDINVAAVLAGCGVVNEFDAGTWPDYLDAAVVSEDVFGGREYGVMRRARMKAEGAARETTVP